jgi:hypothetical protein
MPARNVTPVFNSYHVKRILLDMFSACMTLSKTITIFSCQYLPLSSYRLARLWYVLSTWLAFMFEILTFSLFNDATNVVCPWRCDALFKVRLSVTVLEMWIYMKWKTNWSLPVRFHKSTVQVPVLSHINSVHVLLSCLVKSHLNVPSMPRSSKWSHPFR